MTVVIPEGGDHDYSDEAEHNAAVSEGAAEVHQEQAAQAAAEADAAAVLAAEAASANLATAEGTAEAAVSAQDSANEAGAARDAVLEALNAQTIALSSLTEELRAGREAAATPLPTKRAKSKTDRAPSDGKQKRRFGSAYYGR